MVFSKAKFQSDLEKRTQAQIEKFQRAEQLARAANKRRKERQVNTDPDFILKEPDLWKQPLHNPYFVRSRRRQLAFRTVRDIKARTYKPDPPATFSVPKSNGQQREVTAFNIIDETVSHSLLRSLTLKNLQRISSYSYAYLPDRGPHDALLRMKSDWKDADRLYIAEFDFKDFFASLRHESIFEELKKADLSYSPDEEYLIRAFLEVMSPSAKQGLSQGTSLSVLLANLAALDLDRGFERIGVGYVRYADDTVVWSRDYHRISEAAEFIYSTARSIGTTVNHQKSPGIRLLTRHPDQASEITSTTSVEFLGHSLSLDGIGLTQAAVNKIKGNINAIIYETLLREPLRGNQSLSRLGSLDRDYVTCIWQLRRYIYGNISENELRRLGGSRIPETKIFTGVVSRYPLATDSQQWRDLDYWLNTRIRLALAKRLAHLPSKAKKLEPYPSLASKDLGKLSKLRHRSPRTNQLIDLRIPSFSLMNGLIGAAVQQHGFQVIDRKISNHLYHLTD